MLHALHQVAITSCKAICYKKTLCGGHPYFKRSPGWLMTFPIFSSHVGGQSAAAAANCSSPRTRSGLQDIRRSPVLQIPVFVLLHLESCKSQPSAVQVSCRGNGNPSWGWGYNLSTSSSVGGKMDLSVSLLFQVLADFPPEGYKYLHLKGRRKALLSLSIRACVSYVNTIIICI